MGFFSSIIAPRRNVAFSESFWGDLVDAVSMSGRSVTAASALRVTPVLACVRVIAEDTAQVPVKVYRKRAGGGADEAIEHPLYDILDVAPNEWQTSFEFIENIVAQAALCGNFYGFKNIVRGRLLEIIPFPPGVVTEQWALDGTPSYQATLVNGEYRQFPAELIWHFRGLSWDTRTGMAAIRLAREAIGLAMSTEEAHSRLHANGVQASGLYSVDDKLTTPQQQQLSNWVSRHFSGENRMKPLILDRGAKWTSVSMTGVDAQHLETRRHQVEEICRAFRVMPIMIGQADKAATYASAEQMFIAHVKYTLMPWYRRIEKSIEKNLLSKAERQSGLYVKFLPNALMRGTAKDRAEFYFKLWQMGALNANEIRAYEEQNPYEGGATYRVQLNTADATDPSPQDTQPPVTP
jgi:HK97 family phage portal protein